MLYQKLGFNAPFIFCLGLTAFDFTSRLIVIEPRDLAAWTSNSEAAIESTSQPASVPLTDLESSPRPPAVVEAKQIGAENDEIVLSSPTQELAPDIGVTKPGLTLIPEPGPEQGTNAKEFTQYHAVYLMMKSPRAMASLINTLLYAYVACISSFDV